MTTATAIKERAEYFGIKCRVWEKNGRCRIYADKPRKDISVFLELDGSSDDVFGAQLKVFCSTSQHPNWIRSQCEMYRKDHMPLWHAYVVEAYVHDDLSIYGDDIREMVEASRAWQAAYEADEPEEESEEKAAESIEGNADA